MNKSVYEKYPRYSQLIDCKGCPGEYHDVKDCGYCLELRLGKWSDLDDLSLEVLTGTEAPARDRCPPNYVLRRTYDQKRCSP